jgi:cysteine-rich repeat protein
VVGDCDGDRDTDLDDYADFQTCLAGPGAAPAPGCDCADFDGDNDVDLWDFQGFQSALREPPCGNGTLDGGEECDDGNTVDGDGCSSTWTNEPLADCTIAFEAGCPDAGAQCGASFAGGGTCEFIGAPFCYSSGLRSYRVAPATSPLIITLDGDVDKLTVFFSGRIGGGGTMSFFDCQGLEVDSPINALGDCSLAMPSLQTVTFSRSVRSIEVLATGPGDVWIDDFHVNPP